MKVTVHNHVYARDDERDLLRDILGRVEGAMSRADVAKASPDKKVAKAASDAEAALQKVWTKLYAASKQ